MRLPSSRLRKMEANDRRSNDQTPLLDHTEQRVNQPSTNVDTEHSREMSSSPHVTFEVIHDDGHHDDASFGLYNSSFDTLSDAGAALALGVDDSMMADNSHRHSSTRTPSRSGNRLFSSAATSHVPGMNDIDLPDLNSQNDNIESSDLSLGDLSPIKLIYADGSAPQIERRAASHVTDTYRNKESDFDWRSDDFDLFHSSTGNRSNPFYVLRSARKAFENIRYLLPCLCLPSGDTNTITMSNFGSIRQYKGVEGSEEHSVDLAIASRRVESAICAFGGTLNPDCAQSMYDACLQNCDSADSKTNLVADNRSPANHPGSSPVQQHLNYVNGVVVVTKNDKLNDQSRKSSQNSSTASSEGTSDDPTKLKYRCKRCGQLKQNHVCPYQQPLQRSIGIMVYPAVNSYNAAEPGVIAPSLSKMNNFISYDDSDQGGDPPSDHVTQQRPKGDDGNPFVGHSMTVTPESLRGAFRGETHFHSPQSSLSAQSSDDPVSHHIGPLNSTIAKHDSRRLLKRQHGHMMEASTLPGHHEVLRAATFVASVSLRPEQFRAVTPFTKNGILKSVDDSIPSESASSDPTTTTIKAMYQYPVIPLSFAERKRMSDTLFYLSQEIPTVTSDCASILRSARQNNEWDIAVAELLTQVVVALYCGEGDIRLDGLHHYLLSLGISC